MKKIAIIGSGDLGQQLASLSVTLGLQVAGFYDDFALGKNQVLGKCENIEDDFRKDVFDVLAVGVGYNHIDFRKEIFERFEGLIPFAKLLHPDSFVDPTAELGEGVVIYAGCTVDTCACIGKNVLLNVGACIAHDTQIGPHSFLSPRVAMAGFIQTGECCVLGINCTVIDNLNLCDKTRLGAGTVLISDTERAGLYVGVPGVFKK